LDCPLSCFKIFEATIDVKNGLKNNLQLLISGLGRLGTGAGSLKGGSSGLGHLEFYLGLVSNKWCAACNPSEEQQPQKISNPLQKRSNTTEKTTTICLSRLEFVKTKNIVKKT
jgi:hypothetical protein